jgi:HK97 family phage major capsid protein
MEEKTIQALTDQVTLLHKTVQDKFTEYEKGRVGLAEFKAQEERIDKSIDGLTKEIALLKSPQITGEEQKAEQKSVEHKAFDAFLRKGIEGLKPEELKVMTVGDDTTGGYLAPADFVAEIIKGEVAFSPIRTVARVRTTTRRTVQQPKRTGTFSAQWVSEIGTRSETTGLAYGLEDIPTHEMYALVKVSKQDLEDSGYNLEAELQAEFAEQFGVAEGTAFLTGNAVGKPEGILVNGSVTGFTGVTTSGKILADDLIELQFSLSERYAPFASWLLKRSSLKAIRLLKSAVDGHYMWQPGLGAGSPPLLLGSPYVECTDMPAEANSAKAVAYGDFRRGYLIVDRLEIDVLRDPYSSKSTGCIEISARKRVGGQVILPEAIKILTLKA